ncbi:MAG: hypothetical protein EOP48_26455 [Sphingobacteriales bacterium]|nr:MAG: hypothetical protein EOP48_26455 [Sphingobacteriales bacterium]
MVTSVQLIKSKTILDRSTINLHDAALGEIICQYKNKLVSIIATSDQSEKKGWTERLDFSEVCHLTIPILEPWGEGYYINSVTKEDHSEQNEGEFSIKILLNSGDEIIVRSSSLSYSSIPPEE